MRRRAFPTIVLSLSAVLIGSPMLQGQLTGRGEIRGVVRDQTDLVIPGAEVVLVHQATNRRFTTATSDVGVYYFGAIPIGRYAMSVDLPGFATWTADLLLEVGQSLAVNPRLVLAGPGSTTEVRASATLIVKESMDVDDVKDAERIERLPLNGRNITALFNLTPGVESSGNARVLGSKVGSMEIELNGISLVDRFGGGMARVQPGLGSIQEFRIETVGSDARYSRPSTVILASRSGTNQLRGNVFWTHRSNTAGLRARRREEGDEASHLVRNEFGGSLGGPLWLGQLYDGRDRTFWYFSYEGLRNRESELTDYPRTPTQAMWNGDLSNLVDAAGRQTVIYDPLTTDAEGLRRPFPGNVIPEDRIHPFARKLAELTARPLDPSRNPVLEDNFLKFYPKTADQDSLTIKVDQVMGDADNLSVAYTRSTLEYAVQGGVFGNPVSPEAGLGTLRADLAVNSATINHNHIFNPRLLNELLVGVNRSSRSYGTLGDFTPFADYLGLPNPFGATGWPTLYASGASPWGFWDAESRKDEALTGVVAENNATWVKQNHVLQFGAKLRWEHNNVRELQQLQGSHTFGTEWTALYDPVNGKQASFTGNGFASLLLGLGTSFSNLSRPGFYYLRQRETGLYVNDKWKIAPRLTINLGLRWDNWTPYREKYDRIVGIDDRTALERFEVVTPGSVTLEEFPGVPSGVYSSWAARGMTWTTADAVGYPPSLFAPDYDNLGPRLGFAYQLTGRTVLRGGYGEYFWPMPLTMVFEGMDAQPPLQTKFETDLKDKGDNYPLRNAPAAGEDFVEDIVVDTDGLVNISPQARLGNLWDGRGWKDARARSWHLTLERQVPWDTTVRLTYTGLQARDLEQRYSLNSRLGEYNYVAETGNPAPSDNYSKDQLLRPNPDWNLNRKATNRSGYSNTHTAQIEVERRFSQGIAFQFFYVYTRSLTTSDAGGFSSNNADINGSFNPQVPEFANLFQYPNELGYPYFSSPPSYDELLAMAYINSGNIPPHRIRYNGIIDLPFGRGRRFASGASGFWNHLIEGWQVAFIGDWRSGFWRSVNPGKWVWNVADPSLGKDQRIEMTIFGQRQRLHFRGDFDPNQAGAVQGGTEALLGLVPADQNQRAVIPAGTRFDNRLEQTLADGSTVRTSIMDLYNPLPRNFYMGTGAWVVDFSLARVFTVTEDLSLRFVADFFNLFNHPNDPDPNNRTGLVNLGRQINEPRTIQFSFRVEW